ncbi:hypothetical protein M407DRAFT_12312 [Tulasnella calospora MUT 4182]|uniref:Uncharacterized protein n=1 Tax=Tulasnella calospora MUT 4182 TaxID=1051891 RepID=A0A0C3Q455_9AGAM|nr:hypothetical protein M407DRAFT_12312 [Tulasnella calospora MUT 4182]
MIDLPWANNPSGKVVGWSLGLDNPNLYDHQHWLIRQEGQSRFFTIQNIGTGKVLELKAGWVVTSTGGFYAPSYPLKYWDHLLSIRNGVQACCSIRDLKSPTTRTEQEWLLNEQDDGWFILQNSRTGTVLEVANGSSANRTAIQGSVYNLAKEEQLWRLDRRSRTPAEIFNILCNTPPFHPDGAGVQRVQASTGPSGKPIEYITLLDGFRTSIFYEAKVMNQGLAPRGSYRYMDFVEKAQEAIRTKGVQRVPIRGIAVLIGVVEGETMGEKRAYNWYLTQDLCSVAFLDAQTGREYTARGLDLEGFRPNSVYY